MRTTVNLDDDVAAALEKLQRTKGLGRSEALNLLARRGAVRLRAAAPYEHRAHRLGIRIDVDNIGEVLDLLDNP